MMDKKDTTVLVIDNGSGMCKAGFAGDKVPRAVFPPIVGQLKRALVLDQAEQQRFIGSKAQSMKGILNTNCPIEHGTVTKWSDMVEACMELKHFLNNSFLHLHTEHWCNETPGRNSCNFRRTLRHTKLEGHLHTHYSCLPLQLQYFSVF